MSTRSPFRRRRPPPLELIQPRELPREEPDPRSKRLVAACPNCHGWYSFIGNRMNNGGMFQIDEGADHCPNCGAEPEEVYPLAGEAYRPVGTKHEPSPARKRLGITGSETPAIEGPADEPPPPSGRVYKRAAQSRDTAGMGMAPVEGTEDDGE